MLIYNQAKGNSPKQKRKDAPQGRMVESMNTLALKKLAKEAEGFLYLKHGEYELYLAGSGDYCVSVWEDGSAFGQRADYNVGCLMAALAFILECEAAA